MEGGGVAATPLGLADAGTGGKSLHGTLSGARAVVQLCGPLAYEKERKTGNLGFSLGVQVLILPLQSK